MYSEAGKYPITGPDGAIFWIVRRCDYVVYEFAEGVMDVVHGFQGIQGEETSSFLSKSIVSHLVCASHA